MFDNAKRCEPYKGRSTRLATPAQRLVLYATDRCSTCVWASPPFLSGSSRLLVGAQLKLPHMGFYHGFVDGFARTRIGSWMFLHVLNPVDKRLIRWSNGALSSGFGTDFQDNTVLLRCTGAKSGKPRDIPLLAKPLDDGWVLIASAGGREKNPGWYYNLKAHPQCSLLVPNRGAVACIAHEAQGVDRDRAWQAANSQYSGYGAVYQKRTQRRIPVMMLVPEERA